MTKTKADPIWSAAEGGLLPTLSTPFLLMDQVPLACHLMIRTQPAIANDCLHVGVYAVLKPSHIGPESRRRFNEQFPGLDMTPELLLEAGLCVLLDYYPVDSVDQARRKVADLQTKTSFFVGLVTYFLEHIQPDGSTGWQRLHACQQ